MSTGDIHLRLCIVPACTENDLPLNMHMSSGHVKLDIAVCKGKNAADKRETMRRKSDERDAQRAMRQQD
jgi:SsrA-binding protein